MSFLSTHGITKSFGPVEVLHGIDFTAEAGSVVALLGENGAGKSTFVKILAGDHGADGGEVLIDGEHRRFGSVAEARSAGIRLISQEIADAGTLTVAENVVLGAWPRRMGVVSRRETRRRAAGLLDRLRADVPLNRPVSELRLGERQIVEIARALAGESRCLLFDEPTAALSDVEAGRLFELIADLRDSGVAIVYITHRLDEVFRIADRACVLRDGRISLDRPVAEVTTADLVQAMVGRTVVARRFAGSQDGPSTRESPVLTLRDASGDDFTDVSLSIAPGEVIGLYGKVGSGVSEVAETLFGMRRMARGELRLDGEALRLRTPADGIRAGVGFLPSDRQGQAVLPSRSVAENLAAPSWRRLAGRGGLMTRGREARAYRRWHEALSIRSRNTPDQSIGTLSGGNQQKVLLARWLECGSRVLVLSEPTRGVDVGARQEIYQAIRRLAADGTAVLVASSDYEDIIAVADQAAVMVRGRIVAVLGGTEITTDRLTESAGGALRVR
ncbi:sugar ABC transporter ATP-binding protein [Actinomadura nitritigenes]|uniref:Sugar ABC transporter ATP-binding protein n=1 Tax=Actinomadura nitritigenes TaxID=134602 RepID=A0ABS3RBG7_9ACTN|nr:sugar ABC transporter ATP-binding protein [Actinomadura nitritigenes]MBO2443506.1 sugar ABC transporter ATP-binding protein [Actinomadura nitritigenes]